MGVSVKILKVIYNWGNSDLAYNTAKNSGGLFKFHALMWGAQTPSWILAQFSRK
jgi:GH35 family endo-1,4-beta-xylanase